MKIVVDTNVLISSLGWEGPELILMNDVFKGRFETFLSPEILEEFITVAKRKKFGFGPSEIDEFLTILLGSCQLVDPEEKVDVIKEDPKDKMILECALEAGADVIITGDRHLMTLKRFRKVKIMSASVFLNGQKKRSK